MLFYFVFAKMVLGTYTFQLKLGPKHKTGRHFVLYILTGNFFKDFFEIDPFAMNLKPNNQPHIHRFFSCKSSAFVILLCKIINQPDFRIRI